MTYHIAPFFLPLFMIGARIARSQLSLAMCKGDDYVWVSATIVFVKLDNRPYRAAGAIYHQLYNSRSQSPCDMAAYLMAVCQGSNFTIYPLPPDYSYVGPWKEYEDPCSCGTVTWSLFAACATCQNETSIPWNRWSYNCSSVHFSSFPYDIPPETAIPGWAYLHVGGDDMWNITAARLDPGLPELISTTDGSDREDDSPNMIGPIVGGVVGGVAVLAILAVWIIIARRRYVASRRPPSTLHGPQGISPYRTVPVPRSSTSPGYDTETPMCQKLNDPSDPAAYYASPLSYERSTTTYTSMTDGPAYGQAHGAPLSPNRYTNVQ